MSSFTINPEDCNVEKNIELVKSLVNAYMEGKPEEYIAGCHEDFSGDILSGIVPSGDSIRGKAQLEAMFNDIGKYIEVERFQPVNWTGVENNVYFQVDWKFKHVPTGNTVETVANVRKVIKDGKICEKYHRVNFVDILAGVSTPHSSTESNPVDTDVAKNVKLVQHLVDEFMQGRGENYLNGCAQDFKGDILAGVMPGGECIRGVEQLTKLFGEMEQHIKMSKFEPKHWCGVDDLVFFTVGWEFEHVQTGKKIVTEAVTCKRVRDGKICEKYHRIPKVL